MTSDWHSNSDSTGDYAEMKFSNLEAYWRTGSHSHLTKLVEVSNDLTASGRYMSVRLDRMLINVLIRDTILKKEDHFCLLEATISNLWDYRIRLYPPDQCVIDSEEFQHKPLTNSFTGEYSDYVVVLNEGEIVKAKFHKPQWELEAKAKTRGWIWLDPLAQNTLPRRFIFRVNIFDRGEVYGHVKDTETLELVISDFAIHPVKLLK